MHMRSHCLALACVMMTVVVMRAGAQDTSLSALEPRMMEHYLEQVDERSLKLQQKLDESAEKVLAGMKKAEMKIYARLSRIDSLKAKEYLLELQSAYSSLDQRLNSVAGGRYISFLDTTVSAIKFLQQHNGDIGEWSQKLDNALQGVKGFTQSFNKSEKIREFLKARKELLKKQFEQLGLVKELKKVNKQVYYYAEQLKTYREMFSDPRKLERKAIELLAKTKLFQDFMKKNSMLASLFRMPVDDPNDPAYVASLAGLQTRAQVNALIQGQISAGGADARSQVSQNLQSAQSQLQQLKHKINSFGGSSSDDMMPEGFKPNGQKTKSFWDRLELGTNIQTQKSNQFFPVTSDLGLSLGYKLNDRSIIGIGGSYKLGWGRGWRDIDLTHEGLSLRSFIDWKIKGSFYLSGGYELNYRSGFRSVDQLRDGDGWEESGLLGLSKVVAVKSKVFKKTRVMVLWDFTGGLSNQGSIVFRIGYSF